MAANTRARSLTPSSEPASTEDTQPATEAWRPTRAQGHSHRAPSQRALRIPSQRQRHGGQHARKVTPSQRAAGAFTMVVLSTPHSGLCTGGGCHPPVFYVSWSYLHAATGNEVVEPQASLLDTQRRRRRRQCCPSHPRAHARGRSTRRARPRCSPPRSLRARPWPASAPQ